MRNDIDFTRGTFRVRGDVIEIFPASRSENSVRIEMFGDEIERIREINSLTGEINFFKTAIFCFKAKIFSKSSLSALSIN